MLFGLQLALPVPLFAATLEELLQQVKDTRAAEAQANAARQGLYVHKANQAKPLADAERKRRPKRACCVVERIRRERKDIAQNSALRT
jgi:hypothetical protein